MKKDDLNNEDSFELLRHIQKKPETNQRQLAQDLGFSLGKLNYLLNALKDKGFVDYIVSRQKMKDILSRLIEILIK